VAAGDNLSVVQKKLADEFKISLTYMDVRFLVDDLGLELKNAAPKTDASDVSKTVSAAPRGHSPQAMAGPGALDPLAGKAGNDGTEAPDAEGLDEELADDIPPGDLPAGAPGRGSVTLDLDRIVRPGSVVSGTVTFSDGVTAKWALDQYGRLMLEAAQKGYQPSAGDVQAFQRELQLQLQKQGF
jgi:hypothetical protein